MVFIYNYQVTIFLVYAYLHILRLTFHLFTRLYSLSLLVMCIYIYICKRSMFNRDRWRITWWTILGLKHWAFRTKLQHGFRWIGFRTTFCLFNLHWYLPNHPQNPDIILYFTTVEYFTVDDMVKLYHRIHSIMTYQLPYESQWIIRGKPMPWWE
jgi:hypothetical protein